MILSTENSITRRANWPCWCSVVSILCSNFRVVYFQHFDCSISFCGFSSQNRNVIGLDNCLYLFSILFLSFSSSFSTLFFPAHLLCVPIMLCAHRNAYV